MATKKIKNIETKTTDLKADELQSKLVDLKKEAMNLRFGLSAGQLPKTHVIRANRREIARVKTAMNAVKK